VNSALQTAFVPPGGAYVCRAAWKAINNEITHLYDDAGGTSNTKSVRAYRGRTLELTRAGMQNPVNPVRSFQGAA